MLGKIGGRRQGMRWLDGITDSLNVKVKVKLLHRVWLFATPWTVAHQAPLSIGFSRQEYWKESEVAQSCLTLCDPIDCSLPGSSVHGIFQAIVLECIAISFSRGSSRPRDQTYVSCIANSLWHCRWIIYCWATREVSNSLAPLLYCCVTWGKLPNHFVFQFPHA